MRAQEAVRQSEERLRLSNEAAGVGVFTVDLEAGCVHYSPELAAMLGFPAVQTATIEDAFGRVHRDDLSRARTQYEAGLSGAGAGKIKAEFRFVRPGGEIRWMTWAGCVHFREGTSGRIPFRIDGACVDITARKQVEEALRESEERFRGVYEHAITGIVIRDKKGRFFSCNPAFNTMLGYSEKELRELAFPADVHPDDRAEYLALWHRLAAEEIPFFEIVSRCICNDGKVIWVHKCVSLLRGAAGRATNILVLVTDITDSKGQEDQIRLLMREVNHRSKNMLTLVQAIARQTVAADPRDFVERFGKRVEALAANQDLLVKNAWKGIELQELVRSQLAYFDDLIGRRIKLEGPPLFISASAGQAIGMALHELATNAGKYGALSNDAGYVEIDWRIDCAEAGLETFAMSWREAGGPPVTAPERLGFGSAIIGSVAESSLDAKVGLAFPPSGLCWSLQCPASEVVEDSSPGFELS
jgi:PAS domain S-box-containing protein